MVKLTPTKLAIQNTVIILVMIFVFGVVIAAFVMPTTFYVSDFQQSIAENAMILLIVIISGSITAIALNKRDPRNDELVKLLFEKQFGIKIVSFEY